MSVLRKMDAGVKKQHRKLIMPRLVGVRFMSVTEQNRKTDENTTSTNKKRI
jgi:hypothetical protein